MLLTIYDTCAIFCATIKNYYVVVAEAAVSRGDLADVGISQASYHTGLGGGRGEGPPPLPLDPAFKSPTLHTYLQRNVSYK